MSSVLVVDHGSSMCKVGFANSHRQNQVVFPSVVGYPKSPGVTGASEDICVGSEYQRLVGQKGGMLEPRFPIENGIIVNWVDMEHIWRRAFCNDLGLQERDALGIVLLTEAPLNPKANRERMANFMLEFGFDALCVANQAALSLYATGRNTGVVMDSGEGVSHAVPVYQGCVMPHAIVCLDFAGRDLTAYMRKILTDTRGEHMHKVTEADVRYVKEKLSFVALDFEEKMKTAADEEESYKLPDGSHMPVGSERFRCPEALFQPGLLDKQPCGFHKAVHQSIMTCDVEIHKDLFQNVILSGGNTMFKGLPERITKELSALAPNMDVRVVDHPGPHSAWAGGEKFSTDFNPKEFPHIWVSKDEYVEGLVSRKCLSYR